MDIRHVETACSLTQGFLLGEGPSHAKFHLWVTLANPEPQGSRHPYMERSRVPYWGTGEGRVRSGSGKGKNEAKRCN